MTIRGKQLSYIMQMLECCAAKKKKERKRNGMFCIHGFSEWKHFKKMLSAVQGEPPPIIIIPQYLLTLSSFLKCGHVAQPLQAREGEGDRPISCQGCSMHHCNSVMPLGVGARKGGLGLCKQLSAAQRKQPIRIRPGSPSGILNSGERERERGRER